jgi:hypothetical protein
MTTRAEAIELVHDLVRAEVDIMKRMGTRRGVAKKYQDAEFMAAKKLFQALVGSAPAGEEIDAMVGM